VSREHFKLGIWLYSVLPVTYFTGSYRLLNFKNFPGEIGCGLIFDFFLNALPLLFIQAINNTTLSQKSYDSGNLFEISTLQTFCVLSKFALLADIILEFIIFCFELYKLHHLEKQALNVVVRYSEPERRRKYAKRYSIRVCLWLTAILASLILAQTFVSPIACEDGQAMEWNAICLNCQMENCVECAEAGYDGCNVCKEGFVYSPDGKSCIDGSCQIKHCSVCKESGVKGCDACDEGYQFNQLLQYCQSTVCKDKFCDSCETSGPASCDVCIDGYAFNKDTGRCEYTVCRVDLCLDCSISGVEICD